MSEEVTTPETSDTVETTEEETVETVVTDGDEDKTVVTYANGKYKSVGDLEKGYIEANKFISTKLGGFEGAPETYTIPEGLEGHETVEFVSQWGKENQLSDKGFQDLVTKYNEHIAQRTEQYQQAEIKKLGENAKERIRNITEWVTANAGDKANALNMMAAGAEGIEALEALRAASKSPAPADMPSKQSVDKDKLDFMQFEEKDAHGERRYVSDPKFRQRVLELRAQMAK